MTAIFMPILLIITFSTLYLFFSKMKERIISDKQIIVEKIAESVNFPFNSLTTPMITLSKHSSVLKLLNVQTEMYSLDWINNIRSIDQYLLNVNTFNNYIIDIAVLRTDSTVVYTLGDVLKRNYDYCNQEWFKKALLGDKVIKYAPPHGAEHYYSSYGKNQYAFSAILPIESKNKVIGYILCEVDTTRMSDIFYHTPKEKQEGFLLIDLDGNIIYDYDYLNRKIKGNYIGDEIFSFLQNKTQPSAVINQNLYISKQLPSTDWYVLAEIDYKIITEPVLIIVKWIIILLIGGLILTFILIHTVSKTIRRPIEHLIQRISQYDGTRSIAFDASEKNYGEILTIRTKFEEMADKINALIQDVYLAQMRKREMELEALVNQINPHFLYNVLQLIQTEAVISNNRQIEDMIASLAYMLHYTMDRSHERVLIKEEMKYAENYLTFYKARFVSLFEYSISCQEDLLDYPILKFLLQPIVENCFKHGFKNKKSGAIIQIKIYKNQEKITFEVYDNGHGISPERLLRIRENLKNTRLTESIGISNTHSRVQLTYGERYGLTIASEVNKYTLIKLDIPYAS